MNGEHANFVDLTRLVADLERAADRAEFSATDVLQHAGTQIQAGAISRAPVKTGRLRSSIRMWVEPLRVTVGPDPRIADYGSYVEYGTGVRGEFPGQVYEIRPKTASALRFKVGNKVIYAKVVRHPGNYPHPYMRPALTSWLDSLGDDIALVGVQMIVGPKA